MKKIFCSFLVIFSVYADPTGPSSYPYLSGDTWRHFVDFCLSDVEHFNPRQIAAGDSIFVEQDSLNEFMSSYVPLIDAPYILVTANCCRGGDDLLPGKYEKLLDDPHLHAWFTQNMDRTGHPKLHPIPIGLANRKYPWGTIEYYNQKIPEAQSRPRTNWVYVNFQINTNPQIRQPIWDYFANHRLDGLVHMTHPKPFLDYMEELPNYRFIVSPQGGGIDCHRTWETLLLGSYPIVKSSTIDPLYADLPVLVIQSWDELTAELISTKYEEFRGKIWNFEKLYFPYYYNQLKALQKNLRDEAIPKEVVRNIKAHLSTNSWPDIYYDVLPKVIQREGFKSVLEVGVALGGHAETILKNCEIDVYYGVDPYRCYDAQDGFQRDVLQYSPAKGDQNFDYLFKWVKNVRLAPYGDRCQLIRKPSVEAAALFADGSIDCIFIDGDHRYQAVVDDLKAWMPKVKPGGMILGDDYWMEPVARAVENYFASQGKLVHFEVANSGYKIWAVSIF